MRFEKSAEELNDISIQFYRNFGDQVLETIKLLKATPERKFLRGLKWIQPFIIGYFRMGGMSCRLRLINSIGSGEIGF